MDAGCKTLSVSMRKNDDRGGFPALNWLTKATL
jgi:hypothetical protein